MRTTLLVVAAAIAATSGLAGEPLGNPFATGELTRDWERTSNYAAIRNGVLVLDTLHGKQPVAVFRKDKTFVDTQVASEFRIERVGGGARAFRIVFGSTDGQTYFALEIDGDAMTLVRVLPGQKPQTLARRAVRDHTGEWVTARLECRGSLCRAYYDGQTLELHKIPGLEAGRVGACAVGGRVDVRGFTFGGTASRLAKAWRLRPAPTKAQP